MRYRFADLTLDDGQRLLTRGSDSIPLSKLTYSLLLTLVKAAPNVVTHDQFVEQIWRGRTTSPETITQRIKLLRDALGDDAEQPKYIALSRGQGYRLISKVHVQRPGSAVPGRERSIAVLPFENLSPDANDAYFAVGIHHEIIAQLAKIADFRVIARTSTLAYANSGRSVAAIADELQVEAILEGSLRYAGGRVRFAVQLIDAATSQSLWSEVYEHQLADALAIQADVASSVINALSREPSTDAPQRAKASSTILPEAYALFLRALGASGTEQHLLLDRVIHLDPRFANSYAYKARLYVWSLIDTIVSGAVDPAGRVEREQQVRAYAEHALRLDPENGIAHESLAVLDVYRWQWSKAEKAFERAYELGATDGLLRSYAWFNSYAGRHEKALQQARTAVRLSPKQFDSYWYLAAAYGYANAHDAAVAALMDARELAPTAPIVHVWLAHMETARGNREEALNKLLVAEQLLGQPKDGRRLPIYLPELAHAYGRLGHRAAAQRVFNEIEELSAAGRPIGAGTWAQAYLAIGDQRETLKWLHVAIGKIKNSETDPGFLCLMFLKANVLADPILDLPEFVKLRAQLTGC